MHPKDFLHTARDLATNGRREGDWRSSISRAYYCAFLTLREVLKQEVPEELLAKAVDKARKGRKFSHHHVVNFLKNGRHEEVSQIGADLRDLKVSRQQADYELQRSFSAMNATWQVEETEALLQSLDDVGTHVIGENVTEYLKEYCSAL